MFVWTLRMSKKEIIIVAAGLLIFIALCAAFLFSQPKAERAAAMLEAGYSLNASNADERKAFLEQFGWKCSDEPVFIQEIVIPSSFSEEYTKYNELQLTQGFDLSSLMGQRVKLWRYRIDNYPAEGEVFANILTLDGTVVGADISSDASGGFTHGIDPNQNAASTTMAQLQASGIDRSVPDSIPVDSDAEPEQDE